MRFLRRRPNENTPCANDFRLLSELVLTLVLTLYVLCTPQQCRFTFTPRVQCRAVQLVDPREQDLTEWEAVITPPGKWKGTRNEYAHRSHQHPSTPRPPKTTMNCFALRGVKPRGWGGVGGNYSIETAPSLNYADVYAQLLVTSLRHSDSSLYHGGTFVVRIVCPVSECVRRSAHLNG